MSRTHYHYQYLIVGGGMTADAAVRGIREVDVHGSIGVISSEPDPPYKRPPLSKKLWAGKPISSIWLGTADRGADLHLGRTARVLDLRAKHVIDDRGTTFAFDKLLLATGARPQRLPFRGHDVEYFRTLDDYRRLRDLADSGERFAILGGGFIGTELAAALTSQSKAVTMLFPEHAIGGRLFPPDLAKFLTDDYRARGVEVLIGTELAGVVPESGRLRLEVRTVESAEIRSLVVDGIVAGIGVRPNIELAQAAGLHIDNGIVVDSYLRTEHPDVYAAGDVANVPIVALGERRRVEHEDQAKATGKLAGRAMAGEPEPYQHLPFFYSDLFDNGYEAVGDVGSHLQSVATWDERYRKGTIRYLQDGRVRGVLLWNTWNRVGEARRLIEEATALRVEARGPAITL